MQPYPQAQGLVLPGHPHGTGCLSARAMDTGFPTVVWCARLVLGFTLPWLLLIWVSGLVRVPVRVSACLLPASVGACGVCGWMRAAPGLHLLGKGSACVCFGTGCGAAGGYEGRGVALFPPFLAWGSGVCLRVQWDVSCPFLVGFAGGACCIGDLFVLQRSCPGRGACGPVWVFLYARPWGFFSPAGVCSCHLWGGRSLTCPGACPVRCAGPSSTWVVVRPCLPTGGAVRGGGLCGGRRGRRAPPPCFLFGLSDGEPFVGRGRGTVAWWPGVRFRLSPAVPPPPLCTPFFISGPWLSVCLFPGGGGGGAPACPGCLFL